MLTKDDEIFEGKSFSNLLQDIYNNSTKKKKQIDVLINELRPFITDANKAVLIVPILKDYLDIGVKNDELLVKMAAVYQKFLSGENRGVGEGGGGNGVLSDDEKEQILKDLNVIKKQAGTMPAEDSEDSKKIIKLMEDTEEVINKIQESEKSNG